MKDRERKLHVICVDGAVATGTWARLSESLTSNWGWETLSADTPRPPKNTPCAQRCRLGDHLIHAIARHHKALLITNDKELRKEIQQSGWEPGAASRPELEQILGINTEKK